MFRSLQSVRRRIRIKIIRILIRIQNFADWDQLQTRIILENKKWTNVNLILQKP